MNMMNRNLTRRDFLHVAGATAMGLPLVPFVLRAEQSPGVPSLSQAEPDAAPGSFAHDNRDARVMVESGVLQGFRSGRLFVFRAVPYAKSGRFGPPSPVTPWHGIRPAVQPGPVCPQLPSRLEMVMGQPKEGRAMSEDCQVMSIFSPGLNGKRPVMVWIHGGAYVTGGGEESWYNASKLADEGDIVAVTMTYRLGAFGYLNPEASGSKNPGLHDQMAALAWIQRNIARFGGDPDNVTVFGQSAGGHSIAAMLATCERPLFQRAIIQSAPAGTVIDQNEAETIGRGIRGALGNSPVAASTREMLAAQKEVLASSNRNLTFGPIGIDTLKPIVASDVHLDVMITWTHSDAAPFVALRRHTQSVFGGPIDQLSTLIATRLYFSGPSRTLAGTLRDRHQQVACYEISWRPQGGCYGACHCIELPLLFGNKFDWDGAPMLGSASWEEVDRFGKEARALWAAFARSGEFPRPTAWFKPQAIEGT